MAKFQRSRSIRRLLPLLSGLIALVAGTTACSTGAQGSGDLLDRVRESGTLRVANTQANPPWNFLDEASQPVGYDVDVANELARRLGVAEVEFIPSNFQSFIEGVRADRFDMVISGQTITDERREQVDFSRPYQVNGVSIFVQAGESSIATLADLAGRSVGVSAGTTQEKMAREQIDDADVRTYQNATLALTDLSRGGVDAMLVSRFQGTFLAEQNDLPVEPAGELLEREVNAMTFQKDSPRFKQAVDEALAAMIEDGTLTRLSERWLGGLDMAAELAKLPADQNR
ncbi:transporter substrate-binding domain-containing protein [Pseudonocardia kunmingensis]|uniref:Cystine transport system substrate-binding protein n=1 Tax=Pseudonocardia kunmingensis TaxID=630975 RepID=A0A543DKK3_9PSEU|nr:transporter substrate-binding domain-containing protein [Pseudonocardia kunmingensis]TQM09849.1 cystine transport system substrate-binding protein [Pseudonocardia kunmingensis]